MRQALRPQLKERMTQDEVHSARYSKVLIQIMVQYGSNINE
jgi:hypothetical protein